MARKQWLSVGELTHEGFTNKDAVVCYTKDTSENVTKCSKAGTPPSATTGYAIGCEFTNTSTGEKYVNTGTATSCTFTLVPSGAAGSVTTAMLAANAVTPIKMGTRTLVALADSAATPTIAQLMTSSIFTITPTVDRTFTTPTAAVMVAGVSGATIGTWFDFVIVNLSASTNDFGITLTAGDAGVTLVGNVVVNSGSAVFRAVLTNVTASSEALTIYRLEDSVPTSISGLTSSVAELNYLDITTLGTGAASKAVVLDASGNYIMPSAGLFGMSRGTLAAAGSGASDAAVITQQVTAVTGSNGTLAVALPAAATATGPLLVINTVLTTGATLPVFPVNGGNDNINGGAEDAAFTMGPGKAAWFIPTSATQWYVADASGVTSTKAEASILTGVTATAAEINYNDIAALGTGAASKSVVLDGSGNYTWPAAGILTHSGRIFCNTAPVDYTHSSLSVGVYGTPVVDTAVVDNIAFAINMSTATNKTAADTSCMAAFIGVSNTAATVNNKLQGLLASTTVGYNCYDAYAVQGHIGIAAAGISTTNANAHLTGLSGKATLTGAVGQGWVSGVLAIVEGAGAVTGLCHVIAAQVEATCTDSVVDSVLFLGADAIATAAIKCDGGEHLPAFLDMNTMGNSGFVTTGGTDCTASAATDPSFTIKVIAPGGDAGYIRVWAAA